MKYVFTNKSGCSESGKLLMITRITIRCNFTKLIIVNHLLEG